MPLAERFAACVQFEQNSGCWLWDGTKSGNYPSLANAYAHRFSYEQHNGPIPEGMDVCHQCDTPLCVRPDHLFLGTRAVNIQDAVRKGRMTNRNGKRRIGIDHHNAKLTPEDVRCIRLDPRTPYKIARDYGVADYTIYCIKHGLTWKKAA